MGVVVDLPKASEEPGEPPTLVPTEVKTLEQGAAFGELALMSRKPRAATIVAKEDTHLACLEKSHFVRILSTRIVSANFFNEYRQRREKRENYFENLSSYQV